jgi:hypothetical protein
MITIHKGKTAFKIAPNPLLMYFTPKYLTLLNAKLRILNIVFHCFPWLRFYTRKANVKDSSNKLSDRKLLAGICLTFFEAIHVVPKKHTQKTRPIWVIQLNLS